MNGFWDGLQAYGTRWHDVWEIIGAIGTVFAVVVALWLGLRENTRHAAEMDRIGAERDEARRERDKADDTERQRQLAAQAKQIVIWTEVLRPRIDGTSRGGPAVPHVQVLNASDMPVFAAAVRAIEPGNGTVNLHAIPVLHPGPSVEIETQLRGLPSSCWVQFRDAAGTRWRRYADGTLANEDELDGLF